MSEIQSVEGKPIKKGLSPGRTSAVGALILLAIGLGALLVGQVLQAAPIPSDHVLALLTADGDLDLATLDGSASSTVAEGGDATAVRWAPGGDFVTVRRVGDLAVVDRDGVVAWRHELRSPSASFAWSPDGSRIAIYDGLVNGSDPDAMTLDASLEVLSATGVLEWKLPLPDGFGFAVGYEKLAWSPDGTSFAFTGFTERVQGTRQWASLWLADVGGQTIRQVTSDIDTFQYGPAWSAGGGLVVAESSTLASGIWRIDPISGDRTEILRTAMELCPVHAPCSPARLDPLLPSPDGVLLAFDEPTFGLSTINVATRELIKVQEPGTLAEVPGVWSDDGSALLYLRHPGRTADPAAPPALVRFDLGTRATTVIVPAVRAFDLLAGAAAQP